MNENSMNGLPNPARPVAVSAMILLCLSLTLFFFQFAQYFVASTVWKGIIKILGGLSMISAVLIFTPLHDLMTTLSSIFGVLVVVGIIRAIYKTGPVIFKVSGVICMILLGMNNLIYYSGYYIDHLPLIQKITFALVLAWIVGLNLTMKRRRVEVMNTQ